MFTVPVEVAESAASERGLSAHGLGTEGSVTAQCAVTAGVVGEGRRNRGEVGGDIHGYRDRWFGCSFTPGGQDGASGIKPSTMVSVSRLQR
jgi:hypothetical protein